MQILQGELNGRVFDAYELDPSGKVVQKIAEPVRSTRVDVASATLTYVGVAPVGSLTSASVWRIQLINTSSGTSVLWTASGEATAVWDDRVSLTYA